MFGPFLYMEPSAMHTQCIQNVKISPNEKQLLTQGEDGCVKVWDFSTGELLYTVGLPQEVRKLCCYSPSGEYILTFKKADGGRTLRLLKSGDGTITNSICSGIGAATAACFSPDGTHIAVGTGEGAFGVVSGAPSALQLVTPVIGRAGAGNRRVNSLSFCCDNTCIVLASASGCVEVWDFRTQQRRFVLRDDAGSTTRDVSVSPDGNFVAAGKAERDPTSCGFDVWSLETGLRVLEIKTDPDEDSVRSVQWLPLSSPSGAGDSTLVSCSSSGLLRLWSFDPANLSDSGKPLGRALDAAWGGRRTCDLRFKGFSISRSGRRFALCGGDRHGQRCTPWLCARLRS